MAKRLVVLTGASRGMGAAMAEQLGGIEGVHLLTVSRRPDPELEARLAPGATLTQWGMDLADSERVARRLSEWLEALGPADCVLINNAATLVPPGPLGQASAEDLLLTTRVGLEAPLVLTAAFLAATSEWETDRRVLTISSGLGRQAMAGSVSYCAVKAGVDHLTRALALEEQARPHGAKVVSLAPGVIDTDMQVQLRGADRSEFPEGERFEKLHATGRLTSPADAAAQVLAYLDRPDFGADPVADVRG